MLALIQRIIPFILIALSIAQQPITPAHRKELREILRATDVLIDSTDKFLGDFKIVKKHSDSAVRPFINQTNTRQQRPHIQRIQRITFRKALPVRKYVPHSRALKEKFSNQPVRVNNPTIPRVQEFPYFSPVLNVSDFTPTADKCQRGRSTELGYFIPIIIPPKRMLRVSTCNSDTNVPTTLSVMYDQECLQVIERKCRRWSGNIIEYIPTSKNGIQAEVRVGANNIKNGRVRVTVYTVPITDDNKHKLQKGTVLTGNTNKRNVLHTHVNKTEKMPTITLSKKSTIATPKQAPKTEKTEGVYHESVSTRFSNQLRLLGGWFRVVVAVLIVVVLTLIGLIVFNAVRPTTVQEQYAPF